MLCKVLRVSKSGYYQWLSRPPSQQSIKRQSLLPEIRAIHESMRRVYGARRIKEALATRKGIFITRKTVGKLMKQAGVVAKYNRPKKPTANQTNQKLVFFPNLLDRNFDARTPNECWVADIKYVATNEGWLFLATVIDLFARRIVGWSMADCPDSGITVRAFRMALTRRGRAPLIFHSDRGTQYTGEDFRKVIEEHPDCQQSMSRKANCLDNAVAESFFSTLERELLSGNKFASREQASGQIFEYIEGFYNPVRSHSRLNYVSPVEFEMAMQTTMSG